MASAFVEPMSEAERRDMLRLIEERKHDLLEKKKLLETLMKGESKKFSATTTTAVPEPTSLLKDVMSAMSEAQSAAAAAVVVPSIETAKLAVKDGKPTPVDAGARYSRALKRVVGPLATRTGVVDVIITPKVIDRFEKSCQCDPLQTVDIQTTPLLPTVSHEVSRGGGAKVTKHVSVTADVATEPTQKQIVEKVPQAPLTEEEKKKLIYSSEFDSFFHKASRMVERALGESELFNVFADYSQLRSGAEQSASARERLRELQTYEDDRWSSNRAILDVQTHPTFNDLFLVSYAQKSNASIHDPDGCALIWNISMPQRAEYVFSCQSQVCTAMFDTYRPNNVIGGTFTGSIVLWDTRAKVYSMQMVGTEHAHNLVTVDLDGRLCVWSLSMLVQPTETIELKKSGKDICCMCMDFAEGENNSFIGGTEDGSLFQAQIHGSKAGIVESFNGHTAPVTSTHWHPVDNDDLDCSSDLLLSSSFDQSVKLWSPKSHSTPLHSFQSSDDYCTDVGWHPQHPAIFASAQADGELNIWDISKDIEVPHATQSIGQALTCLRWSNDGNRLMTGDAAGAVTMWGVSSEISQPRQEDRLRLAATIEELKATEQVSGPLLHWRMDPQYDDVEGYPRVDQQQQLLNQGQFPRVPTTAAHLADQIERSGAKIEETLTRLNCRYQSLFFVASWGVVTASIFSICISIFHFEISNLINSIFLLIFGAVMMVLDIPGSPRWAGVHRKTIRKFARFLTRLTGKAVWFLYLGCMVVVCLWPRQRASSSGFFLFLAIFLSLFVNVVALLGLFIALRKSLRLEKVRKSVHANSQNNWPDVYRKYAVNDPSHGMQFEELNRLASDYSQGKLLFDLADLQIIFNALDEHQKSAINEVEFGQWISAGYRDEADCCANRASMTYL